MVPFFGSGEASGPQKSATPATATATATEQGSRGRGGQLDVMTFNLRLASSTGKHSWPVRRPVMRKHHLPVQASPSLG